MVGRFGVAPSDDAIAGSRAAHRGIGASAHLQLHPGAAETIPALAEAGVRLGLISDTGLTPGRILLEFLERDGLLPTSRLSPSPTRPDSPSPTRACSSARSRPWESTPAEAAHVGDTPRTDIAGAQAVGMLAIRFAAAVDHPEPPGGRLVIYDHRDLLGLAWAQSGSRPCRTGGSPAECRSAWPGPASAQAS